MSCVCLRVFVRLYLLCLCRVLLSQSKATCFSQSVYCTIFTPRRHAVVISASTRRTLVIASEEATGPSPTQ